MALAPGEVLPGGTGIVGTPPAPHERQTDHAVAQVQAGGPVNARPRPAAATQQDGDIVTSETRHEAIARPPASSTLRAGRSSARPTPARRTAKRAGQHFLLTHGPAATGGRDLRPQGRHAHESRTDRPFDVVLDSCRKPRHESTLAGTLSPGARDQVETVPSVLDPDVPVHGVLCLVDADWPMPAAPSPPGMSRCSGRGKPASGWRPGGAKLVVGTMVWRTDRDGSTATASLLASARH